MLNANYGWRVVGVPTSRLTRLTIAIIPPWIIAIARAPPRAAFSGKCSHIRLVISGACSRAARRRRPAVRHSRPQIGLFGASVASAAAATAASSMVLWLDPMCSSRGGGGSSVRQLSADLARLLRAPLRADSARCATHAAATTNQTCPVCSVLTVSVY